MKKDGLERFGTGLHNQNSMALTQEQIERALSLGVTQEQIDRFNRGVLVKEKKSPLEKIGSVAGLDVIGKKIAGAVAPTVAKVFAPGTEQYTKEIVKKEDPTLLQTAGAVGKLGLTVGTLGTGAVATKLGLTGGKALAARVAEGGIIGGAFTALDNLSKKEKITKNLATGVAIGGAIPLAGAAVQKVIGGTSKKLGENIQKSLIKPTKTDISDGFRVENIKKYNLGGSLSQTLEKTNSKLNDLTKQLYSKLGSRKDTVIDLNEAASETANRLLKDKSKYFGNVNSVKNVLGKLSSEIEETSGNGLVDLMEAQAIKKAAGVKGAWVFGHADPDAEAIEMVYTKFYQVLREEIEKKAPEGVREINKQIGELIPISHALIRRIPVAERNNAISLTDLISLGFSAVDPKAWGIVGINRLTKSGNFANLLTRIGDVKNLQPKGAIGQRIFGR